MRASGDFAVDLSGQTTVQELIELLRMSEGCVTNDTGTMHLAAMIGIPTVAIFSTRISPTHWFPVGEKVVSIFSLNDCSFCYNDDCRETKCLRNIDVSCVLQEMEQLFSGAIADKQCDKERSWPSAQPMQEFS